MAYFHGIVSRFSAGAHRAAPPSSAQASFVASQIRLLGISHGGVQQLLTGQLVASAEDRKVLANFLTRLVLDE